MVSGVGKRLNRVGAKSRARAACAGRTNQLLVAATTLSDFLPLRDWDLMCGLVCHVPSVKGLKIIEIPTY